MSLNRIKKQYDKTHHKTELFCITRPLFSKENMGNLLLHPSPSSKKLDSLRKLTHLLYALYALTWLSGGLTAIIAIIINYVKFEDTRNTVYESHFRWQQSTFWWALFWGLICLLLITVFVGFVLFAVLSIWLIYRIVKGWLYLNDGRAIGSSASPH